MYDIDPDRTDLLEEFDANPGGPYSPELADLVKRLRTGPLDALHAANGAVTANDSKRTGS